MSRLSLIIAIVLTVGLAIFFLKYAQLDLRVTQYFYLGGHNFLLVDAPWANMMRKLLYQAAYLLGGLLLLALILKFFKPTMKIRVKFIIYCLAIFILVPTLLVNTGFKNNSFHRPRPRQIQQFGGTLQFKPAWVVSSECKTNCSFVCGDCAAVFTLWAFLPFWRRRAWKFAYGTAVFLLGSLYGYIRIGQGGHFLSDVVFAALVSYIGVWIVYWFFYRYSPRWLDQQNLENAFLRAHRFVFRR